MFYFLLFVAALTSTISLHEVATAYVSEEFNVSRRVGATVITCTVAVLGTLCALSFGPLSGITLFDMNIFELFDEFSGSILLPLSGMLIAIFAGWTLDRQLYRDEISNHGEIKAPYFKVLIICLRYVAPVAVCVVFLDKLGVFDFLK